MYAGTEWSEGYCWFRIGQHTLCAAINPWMCTWRVWVQRNLLWYYEQYSIEPSNNNRYSYQEVAVSGLNAAIQWICQEPCSVKLRSNQDECARWIGVQSRLFYFLISLKLRMKVDDTRTKDTCFSLPANRYNNTKPSEHISSSRQSCSEALVPLIPHCTEFRAPKIVRLRCRCSRSRLRCRCTRSRLWHRCRDSIVNPVGLIDTLVVLLCSSRDIWCRLLAGVVHLRP